MPIKKMIGAPVDSLVPGVCAVCGKHGELKRDHCKTTQLYRGAICHGCNITLPKYDDDPQTLEEAGHLALARYIRTSEAYKQIIENGAMKPPLREEAPTARKDREGEMGICPACSERVLKGQKYVPRRWKGTRGHDWHIGCAEIVGLT